jgi:hypothetical protein
LTAPPKNPLISYHQHGGVVLHVLVMFGAVKVWDTELSVPPLAQLVVLHEYLTRRIS